MNSDKNQSLVTVVPNLTAAPMKEGKSSRGPLERFARQLELRRVSRTALSYALIMWFNVQIGDVVFPMLGLPDWTLRLIVMIGVMGFPLVLFLAWTFQITPRGVKVDVESRNAAEDRREQEVDVKINLVLLLLGLTLAALLAAEFAFAN